MQILLSSFDNWVTSTVITAKLINYLILRSIRYIEDEAEVADCQQLILTDDLASWQNQGSPPSPNIMIQLLREEGFKAARSHYSKPSFRTNASWDAIVECLKKTQPPM